MKVLAIVQAWNRDDPIRGFIVRWMEKLAERVDELVVLTLEKRELPQKSNIQVYSLGKEHFSEYERKWRYLVRWQYLVRWHYLMTHIMRCSKPDVIFTHMSPIFSLLAAPYAKLKRVPIVTWYAHPSLTWILKLAHHLSDMMVTSVATAYPYRKDKLVVVGQGIDTDLFCPDGSPPEEPPMILCVGRLSPVKDHPTLIRAAALLRERWEKSFRVVILGGPAGPKDEPYVRSLHRLVEELNLQDIVSFHPPVPLSALPNWYRRCTVHVNLTPTGSGDKVAWEAMACGRPCLAANEGFRETMGRWSDLLLFRYNEPSDLAGKLEILLDMGYKQLQEISAELRQKVIEEHSLTKLAEKLVSLFETLI
jgi:glycosyltransferase involved in cell wall biosynthesis